MTAAGSCPRCGARVEPGQEYCLECGVRLPGGGLAAAVETTWRRRVGRRAPWTILGALVVALVMTGVAIAISQGGSSDPSVIDATGPVTVPTTDELPTTAPQTTTEATVETETDPPTTTAPPPRPQVIEWPPSQSGWTVVIVSMPVSNGRAAAIRRGREALASGLRNVGVLDSSEFSSLHPGYYVVFSGIFDDQRGAFQAASRVQRLYPAAYIRQVSR